MPWQLSPATPLTNAIGYYAAQADMESYYGAAKIAKWSHKDSASTDPDVDAIQDSLNYADSKINSVFAASNFIAPLGFTTIPPLVKRWAYVIAADHLYHSRGQEDDNKIGNKLTEDRDEVMLEMAKYAMGVLRFSSPPTRDPEVTGSPAPVTVDLPSDD